MKQFQDLFRQEIISQRTQLFSLNICLPFSDSNLFLVVATAKSTIHSCTNIQRQKKKSVIFCVIFKIQETFPSNFTESFLLNLIDQKQSHGHLLTMGSRMVGTDQLCQQGRKRNYLLYRRSAVSPTERRTLILCCVLVDHPLSYVLI